MARVQEFYKGRRKRRNYAFIPFIVLLALFSLMLVLFYGMQKYAVISKDGVKIELPILNDGKPAEVDSLGRVVRQFEPVSVPVIFDEADFNSVKSVAGKNVQPVRGIFIPAVNVNPNKIIEYAARLVVGNALVMEMKPRSGVCLWESHAQMAMAYSLTQQNELTAAMPEIIEKLKSQDIYLVAQISCCIDELLPTRTTAYCIHTETGLNYTDGLGTWLDPYNLDLRTWIAEMVQELYDLGFDEVVLADVAHPSLAEAIPLSYTREISTSRSSVVAVCGLAAGVAEKLRDREKLLSIYCKTREALVRDDYTTGQNAVLFMKVYDRVYLETDKFTYPYNIEDMAGSVRIGNVYDRLVPVVVNYIPDNTSWVLVDGPEE
ncbi:MAG: hypothetical protein II885_07720 [Oscillospiraceae bacterium]|nr:hypothetical protein [Oscillospiraceae bacterium]